MNFSPFPTLITKRLILRRITLEDWEVISYLRSDNIVNQFVKRPAATTKDEASAFIDLILQRIKKGEIIYWGISLKEDTSMIGSISLHSFSEDKKTGEVGYDLHTKFQKMGIMNEAIEAVLKYGFYSLNLDIIEGFTQKNNENSIKMLQRNRFILNEAKIDEGNPLNLIFQRNRSF